MKDAFATLFTLASALGFSFEKASLSEEEVNEVVKRISEKLGENFASMDELLAYRKKAREEKNWEVADKIRTAFDAENIILKDTKDGTTWEVK